MALLLQSHQKYFGRPLLQAKGTRLAAQELFILDEVILCHNGAEDPCFIYANRAALNLFKRSWFEMVGLPSRLSASQQQRFDREKFLAQVKKKIGLRATEVNELIARENGSKFAAQNYGI